MTPATRRPPPSPAETSSWFRLRSGSPLIAILVSLALIASGGLLVALLARDDLDIRPSFERSDPLQPEALSSASGQLALALAHAAALEQIEPPSPLPTTGGTPTRTADPIGGGSAEEEVRLSGGVTIPLPDPWTERTSDPASAFLDDGRGGWFGVRLLEFDRVQPASDLLAQEFGRLVSRESYSRIESSGVETLLPYGDLLSWAAVGYSAVRTDPQGAVGVAGNAFALVRRDGLALVIAIELTPSGEWDARVDEWAELFTRTASSFGRGPV